MTGSTNGTVWGTNPYTSDSDLNTAAVHAGLVAVGQTKTIHVVDAGTMSNFTGTTRNGVTSLNYYNPWAAVRLEAFVVQDNHPPVVTLSGSTDLEVGVEGLWSYSIFDPDGLTDLQWWRFMRVDWGAAPSPLPNAQGAYITSGSYRYVFDTPGDYIFRVEGADWSGGVATPAELTVHVTRARAPQPAVASANGSIYVGQAWSPFYNGGAGTGAWQFEVDGYTNWPSGGESGTLLANGTVSSTWTPFACKSYTFHIRKYGDSSYQTSSVSAGYSLEVPNRAPTASVGGDATAVLDGGNPIGSWEYSAGDPDGHLNKWRLMLKKPNQDFNDPGFTYPPANPSPGPFPYPFTEPGDYVWRLEVYDDEMVAQGLSPTVKEFHFTIAAPVPPNSPPTGAFDSINGDTSANPAIALTTGQTLTVAGWAADEEDGAPVRRVGLYIDSVFVGNALLGGARPDVANVDPDWPNSGWSFQYSIPALLAPGGHTIEARAVDGAEAITTVGSRTFSLASAPQVDPSVVTLTSPGNLDVLAGTRVVLASRATAPSGNVTAHYFTVDGVSVPSSESEQQASGGISDREYVYNFTAAGSHTVQAVAWVINNGVAVTYLSNPVTITVVGSGGAPHADGPIYQVHDRSYTTAETAAELRPDSEIWAGPAVNVDQAADVTYFSGSRIRLGSGFRAAAGSTFRATVENPNIVLPPEITSPLTAGGRRNSTFSYTITATHDPASYTASLPADLGLSFNSTTGVISGAPTRTGTFSIAISASNSAGAGLAKTLTIEVLNPVAPDDNHAPAFTLQPVNQSADLGTTVTFTAAATGDPVPTYQWLRNGRIVPGETSASLKLFNVQRSDSGSVFAVRATNSEGQILSNAATLIVVDSADSDSDGFDDVWEMDMFHHLGVDPNGDADGDGVTNGEEYDLTRNPQGTDVIGDPTGIGMSITVLARGTGSVTITVDGTPHGFRFNGETTEWSTADADLDPTYCQRFNFGLAFGRVNEVQVASTGVSDFFIKTEIDPSTQRRIRPVVRIDNELTGGISMGEIHNNRFALSVRPGGVLPFAAMDDSHLELNRYLEFGLGSGHSGRSVGRILVTLGNWRGYFADVRVIKGEAMGDSYIETPTHFQARVPGGYVDLVRQRYRTTVDYYGDDDEFTGAFRDFSASTPVASYVIDHTRFGATDDWPTPLINASEPGWVHYWNDCYVLTRRTAGMAQVLEYETYSQRTLERHRTPSDYDSSEYWENFYNTVTRIWPWRKASADRTGLVRVELGTEETVHFVDSQENRSPQTLRLETRRYLGSTEAGPVGDFEYHSSDPSDWDMVRAIPGPRGLGDDAYMPSFRKAGAQLDGMTHQPVEFHNEFGGGSLTTFYSFSSQTNGGNNLDGQPYIAIGEPKIVRQSFGDNSVPNPGSQGDAAAAETDLISTYTYNTDLVDGLPRPDKVITKQGSVQIGESDYAYDTTRSLNGLPTLKTTVAQSFAKTSGVTKFALATATLAYSQRIADADLRGRTLSVTRPDGTKTSYAYQRGTLAADTWTPSQTGPHFLVAELTGKAGSTVDTYKPGGSSTDVDIDGLDLEPDRAVVTEKVLDAAAHVLREASYVYRTGGTFALLSATDYGYDALGNLTSKTADSGRVLYEASYAGFQKQSETDEQGIALSYTYDDYGHVATMTRAAANDGGKYIAATTTTYDYDEIGRLRTETLSAEGTTETLVTSYTYDTASRPKKRTVPGDFTTEVVHSSPTTITTTLPGGATKTETLFKDGRAKSTTGSAVPDSATSYAYDATTGAMRTTQTTGGQTAITESDWLGRTVSVTTATYSGGSRVVSNRYNSLGQLLAQDTKVNGLSVAPTHLFNYDAGGYGRLYRESITTGSSTTVNPATDYDVKEYDFTYVQNPTSLATGWYRHDTVKVWPYADANAAISQTASETYTQVGGFDPPTAAHAVSFDFNRNQTETITTVDRAHAKLTTSTTTRGTTATLQQVTLDGLLVKSVNAQGQATLQTYDPLGRLKSVSDPRLAAGKITTYDYYSGTAQTESVTATDGQSTGFGYDGAGHVKLQTVVGEGTDGRPANKHAYFRYDAAGNLTHQWGDTVGPVRYVYDELGHRTEMHTYRSEPPGTTNHFTGAELPEAFAGEGDTTRWTYQPATGLLLSKKDAANATVSYQYTVLGQIEQRTDARNWVTKYEYTDPRKLLTKVDYTGTAETYTTDVVYRYDRAGRTDMVTDAAGTRTFSYYDTGTTAGTRDASARLQTESLPAFFGSHSVGYDYQFGVAGRANGALRELKLDGGTLYNVTYGYDAALRPQTVTYNSGTPFTYAYVPNSNLIDTVTQGSGYKRDYDYRSDSNRLDALKHFWGAVPTTETRLTYDILGRRQTEKTLGSAWMTTLYPGTSEAGVDADYSYTDRSEVTSSGKYVLGADWSVGAQRTGTSRDYHYDPVGNRTATDAGAWTPNALNQYTAIPGFTSVSYDANGNLLNDGTRSYTYDAENRLIGVTKAGESKSEFAYDYLGRRIEKAVSSWNSSLGTWHLETRQRFLYDGWNVIAELDGSGTLTRRFVWGLDVSGSLQGAGGVGGLLEIDAGNPSANTTIPYLPLYDASHNVIGLYNSAGGLAAAYEYDPFGSVQAVKGTYAENNPFRSATKYTDAETGLVYYGMRFYSPVLGRFLNRDPIEEQGGLNLYALCGNDGVNRCDYLGMTGLWDWLTTETDPNIPVSTDHEDVFDRLFRTGNPNPEPAIDHPFVERLLGQNADPAVQSDRGSPLFPATTVDHFDARFRPDGRNWNKSGIASDEAWWYWEQVDASLKEAAIYVPRRMPDGTIVPHRITVQEARRYLSMGYGLFVNGQSNDKFKAVALGIEQFGADRIVVFHNPTHGGPLDTLESAYGKLSGSTKVGRELANFLSVTRDIELHMIVHSQGAITSNIAIGIVYEQYGRGALSNISIHYNGAAVLESDARCLIALVGGRFSGAFSMNFNDPVPVLAGGNIENAGEFARAIWRLPVTIAGEKYGSTHTHYAAHKF